MLERLSQVREYAVRIFLSVMVSFIFFPGVILGQAIGHFGGELLYEFYAIWGLSLPEIIFSVGPDVISGLVGGALAAFTIGLVDDFFTLGAKLKLFLQIGISLFAYYCGLSIETFSIPFTGLGSNIGLSFKPITY